MRLTNSGDLVACTAAALSLAMTSFGVPAGAAQPIHTPDSYPRPPASAMVGPSGSAGPVFAPVVELARGFPALICGSDEGMLSNIMFTWPARRSVTAGPLPLYGMCRRSVFVICVNIAPDMWMLVPLPLDA